MITLYYSFTPHDTIEYIKDTLCLFCHTKKEFVIHKTSNNKPYVDDENIFFSVSHSKNLIIVAVSDENIGVDAEYVRKIKNKKRILCRFLRLKCDIIDDVEFLKKWTCFESKIKYFNETLLQPKKALKEDINTKSVFIENYVVSVCSKGDITIEKENTDELI